ncbi:hypothetical protein JHD48_05810 [Sulfurimonas sp. SAG-AH-194-I05]|nr:hypothetical protein [Sulfurimonas sp. SAG-AH-194-I05]MDF1875241.1 hypothetical protein [Sulfurimonas sp. SAG-AH-194-I05]
MIKKILISATAALVLTGCNAAQLQQVASGVMSQRTQQTQPATTSLAAAKTAAQARKKGCVARSAGGSPSFTQMITQKVLELAINAALESAAGDNKVQVPAKIMDTCQADQRLAYLKALTLNFSQDIDNANKDILASVEQTKEVQKLQAQIDHKKKTLDESEYNDGVTQDNEKTLDLIKDAKIIDTAKYSAAMGKLAIATPITGYMIVGWDKEILEFAKDNMVWGLKNISVLKDVGSQLKTTITVLPTLASLTTSPLYNGRVDESIAKEAAEAEIKDDKEVAAKAEAENGFGD